MESSVKNLKELGVNLQKIVSRLLANQNLLKLLYYTGKDPLAGENLTESQIENEIYEKLVKIVPRVGPKETANSLISLRVVRGRINEENNQILNLVIHIEVFVPMTQWFIKNSNLRPFAIMSEIQESLNNKVVNGLGRIQGGDFSLNFLTDEISCYEMEFQIIEYK
jgi:hypothetical protein